MHRLACILLPLAVLAGCTSVNSAGPPVPGAQTGTYCPAGHPWYWCTGYRESGK